MIPLPVTVASEDIIEISWRKNAMVAWFRQSPLQLVVSSIQFFPEKHGTVEFHTSTFCSWFFTASNPTKRNLFENSEKTPERPSFFTVFNPTKRNLIEHSCKQQGMVVSVLYFLVSLIFAVLGVTLAYAESRQFLLRVVPDPLDKPLGPARNQGGKWGEGILPTTC